jgi:hypothetical protein
MTSAMALPMRSGISSVSAVRSRKDYLYLVDSRLMPSNTRCGRWRLISSRLINAILLLENFCYRPRLCENSPKIGVDKSAPARSAHPLHALVRRPDPYVANEKNIGLKYGISQINHTTTLNL